MWMQHIVNYLIFIIVLIQTTPYIRLEASILIKVSIMTRSVYIYIYVCVEIYNGALLQPTPFIHEFDALE